MFIYLYLIVSLCVGSQPEARNRLFGQGVCIAWTTGVNLRRD